VKVIIPVGTPEPDTAGTTVAVNVSDLIFLAGVEEVSFMAVALA
jgi:hypothetical protein